MILSFSAGHWARRRHLTRLRNRLRHAAPAIIAMALAAILAAGLAGVRPW